MLLNFWLYSLSGIALYLLVGPLIKLWIGPEFLMGQFTLLMVMLAFYERGMRNSISMVKVTAGIFHEDRFAPLLQGALNLLLSFLLVRYWGIAGIFIGTLTSALLVLFWTTPYLVYKKVFHQPLRRYYQRYVIYTAIGIAAYCAAHAVNSLIPDGSFGWLALKAAACLLVVNLMYTAVFFRTPEFKYLLGIAASLLGKIPQLRALAQKRSGRRTKLEIGGNK
ncbi:hypothetical protein D3C78_1282490 [compost metagenome]